MFYHLIKANVVADALSRKSRDGESNTKVLTKRLAGLVVQPQSLDRIRQAQQDDFELQDLIDRTRRGEASRFYLTEEGVLKTRNGKTVIPNDAELKRDIIDEAQQTQYTVHLGNNKMY
jgi:hypothetical protein